jgi:hypothetical protein
MGFCSNAIKSIDLIIFLAQFSLSLKKGSQNLNSECGCGEQLFRDTHGRLHRFKKGHVHKFLAFEKTRELARSLHCKHTDDYFPLNLLLLILFSSHKRKDSI